MINPNKYCPDCIDEAIIETESSLFDSLDCNFLSSLHILDISPLSDVGLVKIFFPICWLLSCPFDSVLVITEDLQFHEVSFVYS